MLVTKTRIAAAMMAAITVFVCPGTLVMARYVQVGIMRVMNKVKVVVCVFFPTMGTLIVC